MTPAAIKLRISIYYIDQVKHEINRLYIQHMSNHGGTMSCDWLPANQSTMIVANHVTGCRREVWLRFDVRRRLSDRVRLNAEQRKHHDNQ